MPSKRIWIAGVTAALGAGCIIGVAALGRGVRQDESPSVAADTEVAGPADDARPAVLEAARAGAQGLPGRTAVRGVDVGARKTSRLHGFPEARKESEFHAAFLEMASRDPDSFERAARGALHEVGPACRKVAALRALCDTGSPAANESLAAAVLEQPDVSSGHAESIPGFALRQLSMRAPNDEGARRTLEALVFGPSRPGSRLRAAAAFALCSVADEAERGRIRDRLRSEPDALVVTSAESASSPDPIEGEERP